mmetsp:Transcript_27754/g.44470  ORF Transcript_27754/g.44470 Transcript_27754/m.44470 type:complete len:224 (+) Transcript_27754:5301-5972(+)
MFLSTTANWAGPANGEYHESTNGFSLKALPKASRITTVNWAGIPTVAEDAAVPSIDDLAASGEPGRTAMEGPSFLTTLVGVHAAAPHTLTLTVKYPATVVLNSRRWRPPVQLWMKYAPASVVSRLRIKAEVAPAPLSARSTPFASRSCRNSTTATFTWPPETTGEPVASSPPSASRSTELAATAGPAPAKTVMTYEVPPTSALEPPSATVMRTWKSAPVVVAV